LEKGDRLRAAGQEIKALEENFMKSFKPYTPSRASLPLRTSRSIKKGPLKSLSRPSQKGGRNNTGMIMVRHQGGRAQAGVSPDDFRRDKLGVPGKVVSIEYDPNRSARIALIHYADGDKRYICQPEGLKAGDAVMAGPDADIHIGNALPLHRVPKERWSTI